MSTQLGEVAGGGGVLRSQCHLSRQFSYWMVVAGVIEDTLSAGGGGQSHNCGHNLSLSLSHHAAHLPSCRTSDFLDVGM